MTPPAETLPATDFKALLAEVLPFPAVPGRPALTPEAIEAWRSGVSGKLLHEQRMARFHALCPELFRVPIRRNLVPNLTAWDEADAWDGSAPGLWIWSRETGRGKSRMLWRHFGRLHVRRGLSILKLSGQAMAEEYFARHMEGSPADFYRLLTRHQLVFLDDLDKLDLTNERTPRMLRESFDKFYEAKKPVLVTANQPIEWFARQIGESAARRMREVCREVEF